MKKLIVSSILGIAILVACSPNAHVRVGTTSRRTDQVTPSEGKSASTISAPEPSSSPSPASSPSPEAIVCGNAAAISAKESFVRPGSLVGDVDGDGRSDTVTIAVDPKGPYGCRAFVLVKRTSNVLVAAIPQWEPSPAFPSPHLNSLVEINGEPGSEIAIDVTSGASTQFEGIYTFSSGQLLPIALPGAPFPGLFAYGGSVGHLDGQACTSDGALVVSSAVAKGSSGLRYEVVRRFYRPSGATLSSEPRFTQRRTVRLTTLRSYPEFFGSAFAGCDAS